MLTLDVGERLYRFTIDLVAGIYKIAALLFDVFYEIAELPIFSNDDYQFIVKKVYIILSLIIMFAIVYNALTLIIDPDKDKGGKTTEKLLMNIVTSFIMIVLCPTLFSIMEAVSPALKAAASNFMNTSGYEADVSKSAISMTTSAFDAFFSTDSDSDESKITGGSYWVKDNYKCERKEENEKEVKKEDKNDIEVVCKNFGQCSLEEARTYVSCSGQYTIYKEFYTAVEDEKITYNWFAAFIAGLFLCYIVLSFTMDMAKRVASLVYYEVMAPICIACRILPKGDSTFKNWSKGLVDTYLSLYIRILIMGMSIFLFNALSNAVFNAKTSGFAKVLCIFGLFAFLKEAPKLIESTFGIKGVDFSLGKKMKEAGMFAAGGMIGGALGSSIQKSAAMIRETSGTIRDNKGENGKLTKAGHQKLRQQLARNAMSGGGLLNGAISGLKNGSKANSFADMKKGISDTVNAETQKRNKNESYYSAHSVGSGFFGQVVGTIGGRVSDAARSVVGEKSNTDSLMAAYESASSAKKGSEFFKDEQYKDMDMKREEAIYNRDVLQQNVASASNEVKRLVSSGASQTEIAAAQSVLNTAQSAFNDNEQQISLLENAVMSKRQEELFKKTSGFTTAVQQMVNSQFRDFNSGELATGYQECLDSKGGLGMEIFESHQQLIVDDKGNPILDSKGNQQFETVFDVDSDNKRVLKASYSSTKEIEGAMDIISEFMYTGKMPNNTTLLDQVEVIKKADKNLAKKMLDSIYSVVKANEGSKKNILEKQKQRNDNKGTVYPSGEKK